MLKQDKAWAVAMLDRTKYTESMELLNKKTLQKNYSRFCGSHREKDTKNFRKIKSEFSEQVYKDYTQLAQHQLDFIVQPKYTT